jgi:uncharacterized RDD family membrane protein YckC
MDKPAPRLRAFALAAWQGLVACALLQFLLYFFTFYLVERNQVFLLFYLHDYTPPMGGGFFTVEDLVRLLFVALGSAWVLFLIAGALVLVPLVVGLSMDAAAFGRVYKSHALIRPPAALRLAAGAAITFLAAWVAWATFGAVSARFFPAWSDVFDDAIALVVGLEYHASFLLVLRRFYLPLAVGLNVALVARAGLRVAAHGLLASPASLTLAVVAATPGDDRAGPLAPGPGVSPVGPWPRVAAHLVDGLVLSPVPGLLRLVPGLPPAVLPLVTALAALAYLCLTEGRRGRTLGKRLLGLRIADERTGAVPSPRQRLIHVVTKALALPLDVIIALCLRDRTRPAELRASQRWSRVLVVRDRGGMPQ